MSRPSCHGFKEGGWTGDVGGRALLTAVVGNEAAPAARREWVKRIS
jgi:hypothetical protein